MHNQEEKNTRIGKPAWLKVRLPTGKTYSQVKDIVSRHNLHTICQSGNCPNIGECWAAGTATFMILGNICTRSCRFCAVKTGTPGAIDVCEPQNIARSVNLMKLRHCVITSVTRDDLADGGAEIWGRTICEVKEMNPGITIEALIPDFMGNRDCLLRIVNAQPEIVSHNIETVERLTNQIRSVAQYKRSLDVLRFLSGAGMVTKSGIMLGLGETEAEIHDTINDLAGAGCKIVTIGQYLQPTKEHIPVKRYVTPGEFLQYKNFALNSGIEIVESAPLVRSSYHAEKHLPENTN